MVQPTPPRFTGRLRSPSGLRIKTDSRRTTKGTGKAHDGDGPPVDWGPLLWLGSLLPLSAEIGFGSLTPAWIPARFLHARAPVRSLDRHTSGASPLAAYRDGLSRPASRAGSSPRTPGLDGGALAHPRAGPDRSLPRFLRVRFSAAIVAFGLPLRPSLSLSPGRARARSRARSRGLVSPPRSGARTRTVACALASFVRSLGACLRVRSLAPVSYTHLTLPTTPYV